MLQLRKFSQATRSLELAGAKQNPGPTSVPAGERGESLGTAGKGYVTYFRCM